ncbi:hypothetical protein GCM10009808_10080 [Microbacterium sediminicola]|uniref:Integral membrane bound transporter domain-containing protein n=1 Tax=Microbacterium sediminicola TaxID=415210 RepID=A0ABN2HXH5_9MICO
MGIWDSTARASARVRSSVSGAVWARQRTPLIQVVKSALAASATWMLGVWLFPQHPPIFGAIAALLVVQPSLNQTFTRAIERTTGVVVGVLVATGLALAFGSPGWVVVVGIVLGLLIGWIMRMTPGSANQIAISALLVLAIGTTTPDYALDRVLETLMGAAIGFVVNLAIVPPVAVAPAREKLDLLGEQLAQDMKRLADVLETPPGPGELPELLVTARLLRPMRDGVAAAIVKAEESLAFHPRGRTYKAQLVELQSLLDLFTPMTTQVAGMTRTVVDGYDPSLATEPFTAEIVDELRRAAHDTRRRLRRETASAREGDPALTRPLQVMRPATANWILIGALLEDLRRIHERLAEEG